MKNIFKISAFIIIGCMMFASCKTISITKRHYNKGYYVSHSPKKNKIHPNTIAGSNAEVFAENLVSKVTNLKDTEDKDLLASNTPAETGTANDLKEQKKHENKIRYPETYGTLTVKDVIKNPFKLTKMVASSDKGDDALSLIWILLVILLIIYIAGLLLDNFGFGGIFHILGVILLVLLLLWLLKII